MAKLKAALAAHKAQAERRAALNKAGKVKEDKARSVKDGKRKKRKPDHGRPGPSVWTLGHNKPSEAQNMLNRRDSQAGQVGELDSGNGDAGSSSRMKGRRPIYPFQRDDTILLLGEANFSFALSLISEPHHHPPHSICATSYDSEKVCYQKYSDAKEHVEKLRAAGVKVGFEVDAGNLEKSKVVGKGRRWSKIVFNFPHAGAGIKDQDRNILSNQHLLLRTFRSAAPLLTEGPSPSLAAASMPRGKKSKRVKRKRLESEDDSDGPGSEERDFDDDELDENVAQDSDSYEAATRRPGTGEGASPPKRQGTILITLLNQPPYTLWNLSKLGTKPPSMCPGTKLPQPRYTLLRSFEFKSELYVGYEHRRTLGFKEGLSKRGNEEIKGRKGEARTWEFALREVEEDEA